MTSRSQNVASKTNRLLSQSKNTPVCKFSAFQLFQSFLLILDKLTNTHTHTHIQQSSFNSIDEPFGLGRFATGTHSQRPLRGLCSFVLSRCAALLVSCIILLGASRLDSSSATCIVLNYILQEICFLCQSFNNSKQTYRN